MRVETPPEDRSKRGRAVAAADPPAASTIRFSAVEALLLALGPAAAFLVLHYHVVSQNTFLDPFFYTGYIHNFADLWQRFGMTYYGVRFGHILPGRLFTSLLGPIAGYLVLRYLLALLFGVSLYVTIRRYIGAPAAAVTYAVAVSSPFLARTLLWDYPDSTAVPCLTAAICGMLVGGPRSWAWALASGAALGMAINSNAFTIAIFGLFGCVYCAVSLAHRCRPAGLVRQFAWCGAGALAVSAAGACYYAVATGQRDIFTITFGVARVLSSGGMAPWRKPGYLWIAGSHHVLVPVLFALCSAIFYRRWIRSFGMTVIALFGIGVTAFYYVHQFLLGADTLQLFYYFSYAAPAVFLLFALVFDALLDASGLPPAIFGAVVAGCSVAPWLALSFGARLTWLLAFRGFAALAAAGILVSLAIALPFGARHRRAAAIAGCVLLCGAFASGFRYHSGMIHPRGKPDDFQMDVYQAGLQLIREVPKADQGLTVFWFKNQERNPLDWVESTFVWSIARLNKSFGEGDPGAPALPPDQAAVLASGKYRYAAVLALTPEDLEAEVGVLEQRGFARPGAPRRLLGPGSRPFHWALVELTRPAATASERDLLQ